MNLKHFLYKLILGMCIILLISACQEIATENTEPEAQAQSPSPEEVIAHGKYLVTIMGCNDCHSPKRMGEMGPEVIPELMLSGYPSDRPIVKFESEMIREGFGMFYPDLTAAAGPWGVSFAGNLTPDDTGIGTWTEEQFKIALTQGKFKGMENGRPMLPPMPWVNYIDMTDEDIHAVFMYLKSIPAVENVIPPPITPDKM
jgi:mono/diheme cytochrome c family protein